MGLDDIYSRDGRGGGGLEESFRVDATCDAQGCWQRDVTQQRPVDVSTHAMRPLPSYERLEGGCARPQRSGYVSSRFSKVAPESRAQCISSSPRSGNRMSWVNQWMHECSR